MRKIDGLLRRNICLLILSAVLCVSVCDGMPSAVNLYDDTEMLAENYNTYNITMGKRSEKGGKYKGSFGTLEGMVTVWEKNVKSPTNMTMTYTFQTTNSKGKLVLISPDDTVTTLVEGIAEGEDADIQEGTIVLELQEGKYRIKVVGGKDASLEYEFELEEE